MPRVPLIGGACSAKSIIANAQRCVNLYPERNNEEDEAPVSVTHYLTPGLTRLASSGGQVVRGLFCATNDELFACVDDKVYYVDENWNLTLLGTLTTSSGDPYTRRTPVSMQDNGTTLVLVDGSDRGWTINLSTHAFAVLVDATGTFVGSDRVEYLDTFLIFNTPGTKSWYVTLADTVTFDPTDVAQKTGYPDPIQGIVEMHRELWIVGKKTTEIWFNSGDTFPFAETSGSFIEHGTCAKYSIATADLFVYWLSQDMTGDRIVMRGTGYKASRISTHALEQELAKYGRVDDAIGFCYQQEGHLFYVLTFPAADKTWVFDEATQLWHQRVWIDLNGNEHRHRANCYAFAYGKHVVGDWANGRLYALDPDAFTDDDQPIIRIRSLPHMLDDGKMVEFTRFVADMQVGTDADNTAAIQLQVTLRWSDTRGQTWGNGLTKTIGQGGDYLGQLVWRALGAARDRVFEISWSAPCKTALNGAFVDSVSAES